MATLQIYALRDIRTDAYMRPIFLQNQSVLERSLYDALSDENSLLSSHPEDYQVYKLGSFDEQTGKISPIAPEHLFNVINLKGEPK
nr:MAG: nonstructural protein [Microvirus sp.]